MRSRALLLVGFCASAAAAPGDSDAVGSKRLYEKVLADAIAREGAAVREKITLREDHSTWESAWRVESRYYEVRTTHSRAFGLEVAQGLDTMLGHFQSILDVDYAPPAKFPIFIFPSLPEYNAFGEQHGQEHSSFMGAFYSLQHPEKAVATYYLRDHTLLQMWITHAAAHQYVAAAFPRQPPLWVDEGLAAYFSLYWAYGYGVAELERIESTNKWIPLRRLLTDDFKEYEGSAHDRWMELGMLFTYLMWEREDTRSSPDERGRPTEGPFVGYIRVVLNGGNPSGLSVHPLLTTGRDQLEIDFRAHEFAAR